VGKNAAILRGFIAHVWNAGDVTRVEEFIAPRYTIHSDPGDPWHGQTLDIAGFKNRLAVSRAARRTPASPPAGTRRAGVMVKA
jgi:hypothetical protein